MSNPLILTHANCVDGCSCRAIFEEKYGSQATYIAVDYTDFQPQYPELNAIFFEKIKDVKDTEVIMSDICLSPLLIDHFLSQNNKVVIIDHHETALEIVDVYEKRISEGEPLNLEIHFSRDNSESGALLTWKYMHPNEPIPDVITYISEGDIWKFQHAETKPFYTGLLDQRRPKDIEPSEWLRLISDPELVKKTVAHGQPLYDQFMREVKAYADTAVPVTLQGVSGLMAWVPSSHRSEVGSELAARSGGFGLLLDFKEKETEQLLTCSLRAIAPVKINGLAKLYGGGGHPQAAAFRLRSFTALEAIFQQEGNSGLVPPEPASSAPPLPENKVDSKSKLKM